MGPLEELIVFNEYKEGVSITEIAYKNRISVSTVHRIIRRKKEEDRGEEKI